MPAPLGRGWVPLRDSQPGCCLGRLMEHFVGAPSTPALVEGTPPSPPHPTLHRPLNLSPSPGRQALCPWGRGGGGVSQVELASFAL